MNEGQRGLPDFIHMHFIIWFQTKYMKVPSEDKRLIIVMIYFKVRLDASQTASKII